MAIKAFLDTNAFIYAFEFKDSNSAEILCLINEGKIEAYVNMQVIRETSKYFKRFYSREASNLFIKYLLEVCRIVYEEDFQKEMKKITPKIKQKDLGQIAATRALGLKYLISFDRHFEPFPEYVTPKQFLKKIGQKPGETEY